MFDRTLEEGLSKLGLGGDSRILSMLVDYIEEIELFNQAYGLVKVRDRQELIVRHILDSLAPVKILRDLLDQFPEGKPRRIADMGSGAGLPGIPLAICMQGAGSPDAEFTLIERMGRRAGFLRDVLAVLALQNVRVEEADMEELALNMTWAGSFDLIVFRAFKPVEPSVLKDLLKLLGPGGLIAAYKGRRESTEKEMDNLQRTAENLRREIIPLEVPFLEEERHLLLIRQTQR